MGQGGFKNPSLGPQGGGQLQVPLLGDVAAMDHRPAAAFDVVDEDVQATEAIDHPCHHIGNGGCVEQVGVQDQVRGTRAFEIGLHGRLAFGPVEPGGRHADAALEQIHGNGLADAFDRSEDQGDFFRIGHGSRGFR